MQAFLEYVRLGKGKVKWMRMFLQDECRDYRKSSIKEAKK
jgi:hypothetical protein